MIAKLNSGKSQCSTPFVIGSLGIGEAEHLRKGRPLGHAMFANIWECRKKYKFASFVVYGKFLTGATEYI